MLNRKAGLSAAALVVATFVTGVPPASAQTSSLAPGQVLIRGADPSGSNAPTLNFSLTLDGVYDDSRDVCASRLPGSRRDSRRAYSFSGLADACKLASLPDRMFATTMNYIG